MLVSLNDHVPDIILDLRYASRNNITKHALYNSEFEAQLDSSAARAFSNAATFFETKGYKLVVWDAFRPKEVQVALLEAVATDGNQYVLDDSNHAKGLAVDVTLADMAHTYVDMGTDHDEFSERAHIDTKDISSEQKNNRAILAHGMTRAGFTQWPYEWWHFDYLA